MLGRCLRFLKRALTCDVLILLLSHQQFRGHFWIAGYQKEAAASTMSAPMWFSLLTKLNTVAVAPDPVSNHVVRSCSQSFIYSSVFGIKYLIII
jgi:hypothetical protein